MNTTTEYNAVIQYCKDLFIKKTKDYETSWRDMLISSMTDPMLMKLHRVKQIEDNGGLTLVSEGLKANYQDMLNYAVFALIKLGFADKNKKNV